MDRTDEALCRKADCGRDPGKGAPSTVKESHLVQDYRTAKKIVKKMHSGELRAKYLRELKRIWSHL